LSRDNAAIKAQCRHQTTRRPIERYRRRRFTEGQSDAGSNKPVMISYRAMAALRRPARDMVLALAMSTQLSFAQSPSTGEGAADLLPIGKAFLRAALAAESRGQTRLAAFPVSFPLPICGFAGGRCGAVNRDGTVAVGPEYDWVDVFHEGRALVRSGGVYGYVDTAGRLIAKPQYNVAGHFMRGFAQVDIGGRSGLIDLEGRTVLEPRFGFVIPFTDQVFWASEGRAVSDGPPGTEQFNFDSPVVTVDGYTRRYIGGSGKWGLVDRSGSWLRPPEFSSVRFFDRDNTTLMLVKADSGWGVIRPDGSWQIEPKFQQLGQIVNGLAIARLDGRWGFVDAAGQIRIEPKYDYTFGFAASAKLGAARVNNRFGLIDRSGAWVVDPMYDIIFSGGNLIPRSWWTIKSGEKYGLLDENGHLVISPLFEQSPERCEDGRMIGVIDDKPRLFARDGTAVDPSEGQLWWPASCRAPHVVKVGDRFAYADDKLSLITPAKFDKAGGFFENQFAVAGVDGKFGLLKPDGRWAIEPNFQALSPGPGDGAVLAKADDKFGMIDVTSGAWVTQQRFDGICAIGPGLVMAQTNDKRGVLNAAGGWLIEPKYTRIGTRLEDGLVPALTGDRWGFIDGAGKLVIDATYDAPTFFDRGINWVKTASSETESSWCPIDRRGKMIAGLPCQPSDPLRRMFGVLDCRIGR
jgi:hypothetical protein